MLRSQKQESNSQFDLEKKLLNQENLNFSEKKPSFQGNTETDSPKPFNLEQETNSPFSFSLVNTEGKNNYFIGIPFNQEKISEMLKKQNPSEEEDFLDDEDELYYTYSALEKTRDAIKLILQVVKNIKKEDPEHGPIIFSFREYALDDKSFVLSYELKQAILKFLTETLLKIKDERIVINTGSLPYQQDYTEETFPKKFNRLKKNYSHFLEKYPELKENDLAPTSRTPH